MERGKRMGSEFKKICEMMSNLHDSKSKDYSGGTDPYANIRECEKMGIPAWQGTLVRIMDKTFRLMAFAKKGSVNHEAIEDTFVDLANYAVIALILYNQSKPKYSNVSEEGE